jgi:hypothetical protein
LTSVGGHQGYIVHYITLSLMSPMKCNDLSPLERRVIGCVRVVFHLEI